LVSTGNGGRTLVSERAFVNSLNGGGSKTGIGGWSGALTPGHEHGAVLVCLGEAANPRDGTKGGKR